jgi:nitrogen fixation/metabolism regulation signal transduction histidine kinase
MHKHFLVVISVLLCICVRTSLADESARAQMKGLDEQVQEVKSDVLSIAADLNQLEEKLLYPSDTHFAVFVSLTQGETLRLDAIQVRIDGGLATHYIYSFKELEALRRGGVQRLYSGNIATGAHEIEVSVSGKLTNGKDYAQTEHFQFTKEIKPKLLGLVLAGPGATQPGSHLGDW